MYKTDRAEGDKLLEQVLADASPANPEVAASGWKFSPKPWPVTLSFTAEEVLVQSGGMNLMISYLALYIGFVFLIATAAILAIEQLSETSDSLPRYRVLAEIGCDRRMIVRSLRAQVLVYFLVPLSLAVCHTVCAVSVISDAVLGQLRGVGARARLHDRRAGGGGVRGVSAGHVLRQQGYHPRLAGEEARGVGKGAHAKRWRPQTPAASVCTAAACAQAFAPSAFQGAS